MLRAIFFLLAVVALSAADRIAFIDFYGGKGVDTEAVRRALPAHEGDPFVARQTKGAFGQAVLRATGHDATEIAAVCCDPNGDTYIFIGLAGETSKRFATYPTPTGAARLSKELLSLEKSLDEASLAAVRKGGEAAAEDDSEGYAISHDPAARALELRLRAYALEHEDELFRVLESSSDAAQRQIAAGGLGYARQSTRQIAALVHASRDPNADVRNDAIRALGVLLRANPALTPQVPSDTFIEMLSSGIWVDRNKSCSVVEPMTHTRDPQLLARLRAAALEPLIEMASWRSSGHSACAKMVLARIAGAKEEDVLALAFSPAQAVMELLKPAR
jgi:hypothetical protein